MTLDKSYKDFFKRIKQQISITQVKIATSANQQLLFGYWYIGNMVMYFQEKEGYGANIFDKLSSDIRREFPDLKGFSVRNIKYMKAFAKQHNHLILNDRSFFTLPENIESREVQQGVALLENIFLQSVISKVTWSHHLVLMNKIKDLDERIWYVQKALENNWSKDIMAIQISLNLYQRQVKTAKVSNFNLTLPQPHSDLANYMMKDPYIFDFVSASKKANERDIENQLVQHITHFLLELGQGFAFVGRQYPLKVSDETYPIDLLFYNIPLKSYVVIELKARDFEPKDAGQLNFYVNVVNAQLKTKSDNPTIGLILCKGKNATLAEYALSGMTNPLGVADYKLTKAIPDDLRSKLPTIEELENELMETDLEE